MAKAATKSAAQARARRRRKNGSQGAQTKLVPLHDRIVIQPVVQEEVLASGIVIPDTAKEKPQQGEVIAVGPGRLDDNGKRIADGRPASATASSTPSTPARRSRSTAKSSSSSPRRTSSRRSQ